MTNKFVKQYNYAEMSVLNVKSIKVTNGENKDNIPLQVSPKGGGGHDTFCELGGSTWFSLGTGGVHVIQPEIWRGHVMQVTHHKT